MNIYSLLSYLSGGIQMPNKDGTGPQGEGPITGRGRGNCARENSTTNRSRTGCGRGKGLGRCGQQKGAGPLFMHQPPQQD